MAAPHNKNRYGETWPRYKIDLALEELEYLKSDVIISGGWAWHFMSPENHIELKHAHDHKDIDIFVEPENVVSAIEILNERQFQRVWTRYDSSPGEEEFRRYEKLVEPVEQSPVRIIIDFFVKTVPYNEIDGWNIIDAEYLLTLYKSIHSSDNCFAVKAAKKLLDEGIDPIGHPSLAEIPEDS